MKLESYVVGIQNILSRKFVRKPSPGTFPGIKSGKPFPKHPFPGHQFTKRNSDYKWKMLKFMKLGNQKLWFYDNSQKQVQKTRQNDRGIAQVLCFATVIFRKVRQLLTKSSKLKALRCGPGTGGIKGLRV